MLIRVIIQLDFIFCLDYLTYIRTILPVWTIIRQIGLIIAQSILVTICLY